MIELTPEQLSLVRDILRRVVPGVEVRAFGSRVTGKVKRYSDLDLALIAPRPLDPSLVGELEEAFSESDLPFRVDLVDFNAVSEEFRAIIRNACETIQRAGDTP